MDTYTCTCPPLVSGRHCDVMLPHKCDSKPCANYGACVRKGLGFVCRCKTDYSGLLCERYSPDNSVYQAVAYSKASQNRNLSVTTYLVLATMSFPVLW